MKRIKKMIREKGETLIETLVAIMILTISAMLLAQVTTSSVRINRIAEKVDGEYRRELKMVENREHLSTGNVTIKRDKRSEETPDEIPPDLPNKPQETYTYGVDYFVGEGNLKAYQAQTGKNGGI
ncbi:hypothetical protein DSECCO2_152110 [anaerobic digester metagenome]